METNTNLSEKALNVLNAIAKGNHSRKDIAEALEVSPQTVNGTLVSLRRSNLVEINDTNGFVDLTEEAMSFVTIRKQRTGTKMEKARRIFDKYSEKGRQTVLSKFIDDLDMSKAGASTYYQNLRTATGLAFQRKASKSPKIVKTSKIKHAERGKSRQ